MSGVLGRDVGAGQGAGEPGIFVGRSCGWTEGLDEESRERCGWMGGTEGLPGKGQAFDAGMDRLS